MKYVYFFSKDYTEGNKDMKDLLGGKGANLAEMSKLRIRVPPGFTITTEACEDYYKNSKKISDSIVNEIKENLRKLEEANGKKFGSKENPLLVSVRSGAAISMPGMMDTVLNLGLNDEITEELAKENKRFAYDSYRRFLQMFGDVVLGIKHDEFEDALKKIKEKNNVVLDTELNEDALKEVIEEYKKIYDKNNMSVPQDANEQLFMAIGAVFESWNNERAIKYREINNITGLKGTAVNVQTMVFGNKNNNCATGVAFTRNPSNGNKEFFGEFLINAQGEDVVAGIRTPEKISELENIMPEIYNELKEIFEKLEQHYKDMQDIEFTIEDRKLYVLQTRNGKRTAKAATKIAVDMLNEGLIDEKTAVLRVRPEDLEKLLHKTIDESIEYEVIGSGLAASPGAGVGRIVLNAEDAERIANNGENVILVRKETSPEDIKGMAVSEGILTATGGITSHAAVVARGMGICCITGCNDLKIYEDEGKIVIGNKELKEGDLISLNGNTGEIIEGKARLVAPDLDENIGKIMELADKYRRLKVRTNAETPRDAKQAREYGAEGIGLCRTEHMFFDGDRIKSIRKFILARNAEERRNALDELFPLQKNDFVELFEIMHGLEVNIRLIDPPLHEFLPRKEHEIREMSTEIGVGVEELKEKIEELHENNPMMGHRGCRLAITYPEIAEMQTRAIITAAIEVKKKGMNVFPEIMVPFISDVNELKEVKKTIKHAAEEAMKDNGVEVEYKIGTMIEIPRAALNADKIAEEAEFFSFGTNDLTQLSFGFSRDDIGKFIDEYNKKEIISFDPFRVFDKEGVGQLVKMAVEKGKKAKNSIKTGVCGEHGGNAESIHFFNSIGLDYVSCSPFRVPIARLSAAQAEIMQTEQVK